MINPLGFARDAARELRRVPGFRELYIKTDPARRARRIASSGIVDTELYGLLIGNPEINETDAATHYVEWGHWAGLPVNLLLDDSCLRRAVGSERPPAFEYLWTRAFHSDVSPFWDVEAYLEEHPQSLDHPAGPAGHLWDRVRQDDETPIPLKGSPQSSQPWRQWREDKIASLRVWAEQDALRRRRRVGRHFTGVAGLGSWGDRGPQPTVSIVLATWNRAGELRQAVESVISQTWNSWELLIVDDGSWDDTILIGQMLAERDGRIRLLPRPHEGVSAARNAGIAAATGEFVTFLDSDNTWQPRFLQDMMIALHDSGSRAGFATLEMDNGDTRLFRQAEADLESLTQGNVVDLNVLVTDTGLVREIGGFDVDLKRAVDYDLVLRLAQRTTLEHVPIIGAAYSNDAERSDRISTSQPLGWNTRVRVKNLIDWRDADQRVLEPGTEIVFLVPHEDPAVDERVEIARQLAVRPEYTVHLALLQPEPSAWTRATHAASELTALHAHMFSDEETYSFVVTSLLADATREGFLVVDPTVLLSEDNVVTLSAQVSPTRNAIYAPTVLHSDGTVLTIGAGLPKPASAPVDILSRHPVEDAKTLGEVIDVPLLSGKTFAAPTAHLITLRGLDPLLYNEFELPALSIALKRAFSDYAGRTLSHVRGRRVPGVTALARIDPKGSLARVREITIGETATDWNMLLAPLGFEVSHFMAVTAQTDVATVVTPLDSDGHTDESALAGTVPERRHLHPIMTRRRAVTSQDGRDLPALRWAIRVASPTGPVGETWGDTHFARSLASALRQLGQDVVIDHHEVRNRPTAYLDDVTLVLRGLDEVTPLTGGVSMLWVISHPDLVTRREAAEFDRVFAASTKWSRETSTRWGLDIAPLLQCTDPDLFHPSGDARRDDIVFVGNSRGVPRPAVVAPVGAGIPVRIFGGEWDRILPANAIEQTYVDNASLASLYGDAGVVLNDHWSDMRRLGFISNRLFDVVASGGRVLTDDVEGVSEIFGHAVRTYRDSAELVELLRAGPAHLFADTDDSTGVATRVREEHSFLARARVLLDEAVAALGR